MNLQIYVVFIATIDAPVNCTDGDVRLYGGTRPNNGILHVCSGGVWGTMCYNYWDRYDTNVVCYELGYTHGKYARVRSDTLDKYPILFTYYQCQGNEATLASCGSNVLSSSIQYCYNGVVELTCSG